jgi:uncharacterized protein
MSLRLPMKRVFIIHGWDGSPDEPMLRWLRRQLEEKGFTVISPEMPVPETPDIGVWIERLNRLIKKPDEETYFIGHSIGCQAIIRYLEKASLRVKIGGAVFIAPWLHLKPESFENKEAEEIAKPWLETPINFDRVKMRFKKMVCIFSDNDPFVPISDKDIFEKKLGAKTIVEHKKGHFAAEDDIEELPIALNKLLEISK